MIGHCHLWRRYQKFARNYTLKEKMVDSELQFVYINPVNYLVKKNGVYASFEKGISLCSSKICIEEEYKTNITQTFSQWFKKILF